MAAIISDKFRIFNAKQFLESLTEGSSATDPNRTKMYFFVGRPQPWKAYLETYSRGTGTFSVGDEVYEGTYPGTFRATIAAVYDSALILTWCNLLREGTGVEANAPAYTSEEHGPAGRRARCCHRQDVPSLLASAARPLAPQRCSTAEDSNGDASRCQSGEGRARRH